MSSRNSNYQKIAIGLAVAAATSLLLYQMSKQKKEKGSGGSGSSGASSRGVSFSDDDAKTPQKAKPASESSPDKTPLVTNTSKDRVKDLSSQIEVLDKRGKDFFKKKQVRVNSLF